MEPSPSRLGSGVVRAVAPVAGANPHSDPGNPRWLHLTVRSSLTALLSVLSACPPGAGAFDSGFGPQRGGAGDASFGAARRLQDGRWTLAFPDEDACQVALRLVQAHAVRLRDVCAEVLAPLGVAPLPEVGGGGREYGEGGAEAQRRGARRQ